MTGVLLHAVLQKVLGVLNLVLSARDGDDTVFGTFQRLVDLDGGPGLVADLLDALAAFADDGAGEVFGDGHLCGNNRTSHVVVGAAST